MTLWFTFLPLMLIPLALPWMAARKNLIFREQVIASHRSFGLLQRRVIIYVLIPFFVIFSWALIFVVVSNAAFAEHFFGVSSVKDMYCVLGSAVMLQLFCGGQFVALEKFSFRQSILE